jgi:hypothetical protein
MILIMRLNLIQGKTSRRRFKWLQQAMRDPMSTESKDSSVSLMSVFEGWNGYQTSLVNAIAPLPLPN